MKRILFILIILIFAISVFASFELTYLAGYRNKQDIYDYKNSSDIQLNLNQMYYRFYIEINGRNKVVQYNFKLNSPGSGMWSTLNSDINPVVSIASIDWQIKEDMFLLTLGKFFEKGNFIYDMLYYYEDNNTYILPDINYYSDNRFSSISGVKLNIKHNDIGIDLIYDNKSSFSILYDYDNNTYINNTLFYNFIVKPYFVSNNFYFAPQYVKSNNIWLMGFIGNYSKENILIENTFSMYNQDIIGYGLKWKYRKNKINYCIDFSYINNTNDNTIRTYVAPYITYKTKYGIDITTKLRYYYQDIVNYNRFRFDFDINYSGKQ